MKIEYNLSELPSIADKIITLFASNTIIAFYGPMGVGKTTLIKQIMKQCGVTQNVSSPTYSLVNEYQNEEGKTFYHFDFYRIKSLEEAYDIGYEDYFYSGNTCLIEWPEKIEQLLPPKILKVILTLQNENRSIDLIEIQP